MPGKLELVRESCAAVAGAARLVRIDSGRIPDYVRALPLQSFDSAAHDPDAHYLDHGEGTIAFFLTLDAVNFGSGWFPHLRKREGCSGYFTIAGSLADYFRKHGPLSAEALTRLTPEACAGIFGQDPDAQPISELMALFTNALSELGRFLLERFGGVFSALVLEAGGSAERLVDILAELEGFRDVTSYRGMEVSFYKRAQIAAADLSVAFGGKGPGRFDDRDRLTIFADNLVPHVLRLDRILIYDEALAERIDAGELIPAGSEEEVEIRACAVHAVELFCDELRKTGIAATAQKLDFLLWNRGRHPFYKKTKPRHRTRSIFY
jgi:hypothetical protein